MSGSEYRPGKRTVIVAGGVVFTSRPDHKCQLPNQDEWEPGDIFQCDRCKQKYKLVDDQRDGRFWE